VRTVFVVGPDKKIKLQLSYPMSTGRNFDEILRVVDSMQLTAKYKVATPVNWKAGGRCHHSALGFERGSATEISRRLEVAQAVSEDRAPAEVGAERVSFLWKRMRSGDRPGLQIEGNVSFQQVTVCTVRFFSVQFVDFRSSVPVDVPVNFQHARGSRLVDNQPWWGEALMVKKRCCGHHCPVCGNPARRWRDGLVSVLRRLAATLAMYRGGGNSDVSAQVLRRTTSLRCRH